MADLLKKGSLRGFATATVATVATDRPFTAPCVASVASVAVAVAPYPAANDPAPDPDRWCWPHSGAMNGAEIDTLTQRLHHFTRLGLAEPDAERLAHKLVTRDRESDDRRLCVECLHLKSGVGLWSCNQWKQAGWGTARVPAELVRQLQRCDSFARPSAE